MTHLDRELEARLVAHVSNSCTEAGESLRVQNQCKLHSESLVSLGFNYHCCFKDVRLFLVLRVKLDKSCCLGHYLFHTTPSIADRAFVCCLLRKQRS